MAADLDNLRLIIAQFCRSIAVLRDRSMDAQDQCGRLGNKWETSAAYVEPLPGRVELLTLVSSPCDRCPSWARCARE
jgi:hypothetical protein